MVSLSSLKYIFLGYLGPTYFTVHFSSLLFLGQPLAMVGERHEQNSKLSVENI